MKLLILLLVGAVLVIGCRVLVDLLVLNDVLSAQESKQSMPELLVEINNL